MGFRPSSVSEGYMARVRPALDPRYFVGVITPSNLNEVQEQTTMLGYHAQADAVLGVVNKMMRTDDSEALTFIANIAIAARSEQQYIVQEHHVEQMKVFADLYYKELAERDTPNEYSPEAMVDTIKADQIYNAQALSVQRAAIRRMDIMLQMTRPLPLSVMRKLNAEVVNGTLIVMRKKPVLVCKLSRERAHEFLCIRARRQEKGDHSLDHNLLLNEFFITQRFRRDVTVAWLATNAEVLMLSDNAVRSIGLTVATTHEPRYKTLVSRVEAEVNRTLAPHRHLVSEQSRHNLMRLALSSAALDLQKANLRAAREASTKRATAAQILPGHIHLIGRAATIVAAMRGEIVDTLAKACQAMPSEVVQALERNTGRSFVQLSISARKDLTVDAKRTLLKRMHYSITRWHKLRTAVNHGVDPLAITKLLSDPLEAP
jgi:hypothetical protein